MKLRDDRKIGEIICKYDETLWKELTDLEDKTENTDIIIPILGTQGAGKSTLINSVLGEDILPSEADETTCIPVEIRYGEQPRAVVYYKNGQTENIEVEKERLAELVDNNFNPGNEKGVLRIVVCKPYGILRNGKVIVDLPGIGSLTKANEETTMQYITKLCTAVFVISTTPPIQASVARFIKAVWKGVSTVYFVQNIWDGETDREVAEGMEYNKKILKDVFKEVYGREENVDILPINVYEAAVSAFRGAGQQSENSGLKAFTDELEGFTENYREIVGQDFRKRVRCVGEIIVDKIAAAIRESAWSREQKIEKLERRQKEFVKVSDRIAVLSEQIGEAVRRHRSEAERYADELSGKKADILREEIDRLIDRGVTGGEMLQQAFTDYQSKYGEEAIEEADGRMQEVGQSLQKLCKDLEQIMLDEEKTSPEAAVFYKKQAVKWEKGFAVGVGMAGAVAGAAMVVFLTTPIGAVAATAVGIGISLLSSLMGNTVKDFVQAQRASKTKKEIEPYIQTFEDNLRGAVRKYFSSYFSALEEGISAIISEREKEAEDMSRELERLKKEGDLEQESIEVLKEDKAQIEHWRKQYYA